MVSSQDQTGISFDVPAYLRQRPLIHDNLITRSSKEQDETVEKCLPFLLGIEDPTRNPFDFNEFGVPRLEKIDHVEFLVDGLESPYPPAFAGLDAGRPWMVYWAMNGLSIMGHDISKYRKDVIKTFTPIQHPQGGFGGGHGQYAHLACTYPAVMCIALAGSREVYSLIDRQALWHWLGRLKQADGGFQVCENGESDTRGAYCAMVMLHLLNLPLTLPLDSPARLAGLKSFTDGLGEWISASQTFEGGIGGSPGNEAHGAYVSLAIACLCLLGPPHITLRKYLDLDNFVAWLSMRQYAPEGGLAGRTNKLVDACYSHWIGTCFPLVQAALHGPLPADQQEATATPNPPPQLPHRENSAALPGDLFSREALVRYTLSCCQQRFGGLRDKPGKRADGYHTNYALCGLSQCQHWNYYLDAPASPSVDDDDGSGGGSREGVGENEDRTRPSAFRWRSRRLRDMNDEKEKGLRIVWDEADEVEAIHPVFVISHKAVMQIREWAEEVSKGDHWV